MYAAAICQRAGVPCVLLGGQHAGFPRVLFWIGARILGFHVCCLATIVEAW